MIVIIITVLKGFAIGAANVVPGVSGGTMAYLLGIYERLLNAVKSLNLGAFKLLASLQLRRFCRQTDLLFLASLMGGVVLSFLSLAKLLKWGFENRPLDIWAIFFGLILASIPAIVKGVTRWSPLCVAAFLSGLGAAASMAFLTPANENTNPVYLMLCGVVAMASMLIPGLSGSFVLLLMGNYKLVMLDSISSLTGGSWGEALRVLVPVGLGALLGVVLLTRLLSWLFRTYNNVALAVTGGFVTGSLAVIWPWKDAVTEPFTRESGEIKEKITGFTNWRLPDLASSQDWLALGFVLSGVLLLGLLERLAKKGQKLLE